LKSNISCYLMLFGAAMGREVSLTECKLLSVVLNGNVQ
jgi:hypothetical protein